MTSQQSSSGRPSSSLHFAVGEVSGKLDQMISLGIMDRARVELIDNRVTRLETFRWKAAGGVGVIMFIVTLLEVAHFYVPRP